MRFAHISSASVLTRRNSLVERLAHPLRPLLNSTSPARNPNHPRNEPTPAPTLPNPTARPTDPGTLSSTTTSPNGVENTGPAAVLMPVEALRNADPRWDRMMGMVGELETARQGRGTISGIRRGWEEAGRRGKRIGIISSKNGISATIACYHHSRGSPRGSNFFAFSMFSPNTIDRTNHTYSCYTPPSTVTLPL